MSTRTSKINPAKHKICQKNIPGIVAGYVVNSGMSQEFVYYLYLYKPTATYDKTAWSKGPMEIVSTHTRGREHWAGFEQKGGS